MVISDEFYFYLEFSFFILNLFIEIAGSYKLRNKKTKPQIYAFLFVLAYGFSNFFSALNRYFKLISLSNPILYESLSEQMWFYLIDQARLKYCFIILANFCFNIFHYEIFSKPKTKIFRITAHFTSILLSLYLIPLDTTFYKFFLRIGVFLYSLLTLIPVIIQSQISLKQIKDDAKQNVKSTLLISYFLAIIIVCALLDAIFIIVFSPNFSVFYFLAWTAVLGAIIITSSSFIVKDWNKIKKDIKNIISSDDVIYLSCPKCKSATYYTVPDNYIKNIRENLSGITSIAIPKGITCKHEYIIYVDKHYSIRSHANLDFIAQ